MKQIKKIKNTDEHLQKVFNAIIDVLHGGFFGKLFGRSDTCLSKHKKGLWYEDLSGDRRYCDKLAWGNPIAIPDREVLKALQSAFGGPLHMMYYFKKFPDKKPIVVKYDNKLVK